jgi:SAM-dependent methyltransferase
MKGSPVRIRASASREPAGKQQAFSWPLRAPAAADRQGGRLFHDYSHPAIGRSIWDLMPRVRTEFSSGMVRRAIKAQRRRVGRWRRSLASRATHLWRRFKSPWDPGVRLLEPDLLEATPITDRLLSRLDQTDQAAIEAELEESEKRLLVQASPADRKRATLAFGIHYGIPEVAEKTRLVQAEPPENVHAMARGPLAAGGDYYYADLVVDALSGAGIDLGVARRALDFGCSSGRVVRPLAAAYPQIEWHGCDPIADAIAWAETKLSSVKFQISPQRPPLPYEDNSFDFAFAISIWSHFSGRAATDWLKEMWRVLAPGGAFVLTTQGWHSIAHDARVRQRSREQLTAICERLHEEGFWYASDFRRGGDYGIVNPDWGTAFLTAEWLLSEACPPWAVMLFAAGRVEANQDLYVLQRR